MKTGLDITLLMQQLELIKKNCGVDKIIDDASKISGFVLAKPATLTAIKHSVKS